MNGYRGNRILEYARSASLHTGIAPKKRERGSKMDAKPTTLLIVVVAYYLLGLIAAVIATVKLKTTRYLTFREKLHFYLLTTLGGAVIFYLLTFILQDEREYKREKGE